ncbi:hypothetical protein DFJ58DRAFT_739837 [Suillus subalutaceus]|uniref:uncharacterized protein n=1 Tax=Suillus subalutaceus TaxID=48586 RepID=UPI001B86C041|nr:uncharacterized protein DFJ58DRAFT_739837 [Suillus subalutaceus]KAG1815849.1 hypothetical protein DFJ58DRAFT_739837 [Suillus subalutaceus]
MEEADWPEDRTRMMARFWRNIQVHKYRSMRNPVAQKALLAYQAEQHKRWHVAVKTSVGTLRLILGHERVLEETRERVYWETRDKRDNARDYKSDHETTRHTDIATREIRASVQPHLNTPAGERSRGRIFAQAQAEEFLSACAVCLGRNPHRIIECKATRTWTTPATPFARASAESSPCGTESQYAATGNDSADAARPLTTEDTFAPDVAYPPTELKLVLERRRLKALTPYDPDAWERELLSAGTL